MGQPLPHTVASAWEPGWAARVTGSRRRVAGPRRGAMVVLERVGRVLAAHDGLRSAAWANEQSRDACQRQVTRERSGGPRRPRDRSRRARRCFPVTCGLGSAATCQQTGSFVALPSASAHGTGAHAGPAHPLATRPPRSIAARRVGCLGRLPQHQGWAPSAARSRPRASPAKK